LCGGELILNSRSDILRGVPSSNLCAASKILDSGDNVLFVQEDSRLGMWIGVKPTRHVELFEQLATKYFKGFEMHRHSAGDREWVRFGYEYNGRVPTEITEASEKAKEASA